MLVYSVRGSGENGDGYTATRGLGTPGYALYEALANRFPGRVSAVPNTYPATPWQDYLGFGDGSDYWTSESEGEARTRSDLGSIVAACGGATRLVVTGYSQGAHALGNAMVTLPAAVQKQVSATVLFGDARFTPWSAADVGNFHTDHEGVAGARGEFGHRWAGRVISDCHAYDLVCQGLATDGRYDLGSMTISAHENYGPDATSFAALVAQWLQQDGVAPTTTNTTNSGGATVGGTRTGYWVVGAAAGVREHAEPDAASSTVRTIGNGSALSIVCQTRSASSVGGSTVWDKLADGGYVSDYFTNTANFNSFSPPLSECLGGDTGTAPAPAPAPAPVPSGANRYFVIGAGPGLHERLGPGTSFSLVNTLANGAALDVSCQTRSDSSVNGSSIWDQLVGGGYVSDYYTTTPNFNNFSAPIPQCSSSPTPPPSSPPPADAAPAGSFRYYVKGTNSLGLNVRQEPTTSASVLRNIAEGGALDITCQERTIVSINGSTIWDQLAEGGWVTDYYTTTPNFNDFSPPIPPCAAPPPPPTQSSYRYYVSGTNGLGLNERSSASTSGTVMGNVPEGGALDIVCQVRSSSSVNGSSIWDQLTNSYWVSDYYTTTPNFNNFSPPIPQCASSPPPPAYYVYYVANTNGSSLNEHSGPGTSYSITGSASPGGELDIVCQTRSSSGVNGSYIWDKLTNSSWVSDYYTTTPNFNNFSPPIPQC